MSNIVTLANHIVLPRAPEPAVVDQNPSTPSQNTDAFTTDTSRPLDPQQPSTGAPRPDDDTAATTPEPESGTENFHEVLEKRLSQKSDPQPESEEYQTTSDSDESSSRYKPGLVRRLANTNHELVANNKLPADLAQLRLLQTKGAPTMPSHHVIVALPGKGATMTEVKAKGTTAPGQTHLLSRAALAAQGSAKGQPVQAQPLKTDTTGELAASLVRNEGAKDPGPNVKKTIAKTTNAKNHNVPLSNKKAGADQTQAGLQIADSTPKKPARDIDPQLTKDQNADILAENSKTDALLATDKLSPSDATNVAIASASPTGTPQGGAKAVRTAPGKNQTLTASNGAQSANQKDTSDIQAALTAARTNAVVADTDGSDPAAVEVTALGAQAPNVSSALTARQPNSVNNASTTAAGPSSGGIRADGNMQPSPAQQIIDSIRLNIDTSQQQIYISLNPPKLGRVRIMFRQIDGEITGVLQVEKRETKYDIEQSLPQIVASLQECGVQVGRVNVVINDQNQQGPFKNNDVPNDDFVGMTKHGFTDQSSDDNPAQPNSPQADTAGHVTRQPSNITNEITDNTINVYV